LEIQLEAIDRDGDELLFALRSHPPEGAEFDKERALFSWIPLPAQLGELIFLTFEVSDGELQDRETIRVSVQAEGPIENSAPSLEPLGDQRLIAGQLFQLQLVATDPNGDELSYSIEGESLPGSQLDSHSGLFTWTPALSDAGQSFVQRFLVSDGELEAGIELRLMVQEEGGTQNEPPRIRAIEDREIWVGEEMVEQVQAEDEHPEQLNYTIAGELPQGAQFEGQTLRWTPSPQQSDQAFAVVFQVSDGEFRVIERVVYQVRDRQPPCVDDPFEENDDPEQATDLQAALGQELKICPHDPDFFTLDLEAGERLRLGILFEHLQGDLDLELTGPETLSLAVSSSSDDEILDLVPVSLTGRYFLEVLGYQGAENSYRLLMESRPPDDPRCSSENERCSADEICDYQTGQCADIFCVVEESNCPLDYICHQEWCVSLCDVEMSCSNPHHGCKILDGFPMCGAVGTRGLGELCSDFTDCRDELDCHIPFGCSLLCEDDSVCSGGVCAQIGDVNICTKICSTVQDCADGQLCLPGSLSSGEQAELCQPG